MRQLKYSQRIAFLDMLLTRMHLPNVAKYIKPKDIVFVLLPLCSIILWSISLRYVNIQHMNDLGLVSVLPPSTLIALIILTVNFCFALQLPQVRVPILLIHLVLMVFMLYSITVLVEAEPAFSWVYRSAGYTEYIMRTGTVNPSLDTYFNWPGFYILSAFVTRAIGSQGILSYAAWAPVFFNLIYLGPLYMIFTSATIEKRLVWLGMWFFVLTNWIEQDSFSPQGLNFFLYLVIIAILLKWFQIQPTAHPRGQELFMQHLGPLSRPTSKVLAWFTAPCALSTPYQSRQRIALLVLIVSIFACIVFSHPLTPFFMLASITILVIFRRCTPFWLPILMAIMTAAWIFFMTRAFLAGHSSMVTGDLGHVSSIVSTNVTNRAGQGGPEHTFVAKLRIAMTALVWGLAFVGGVRRLRKGFHDVTYVLLAVAPFSLIVAQSYGGEMLLRIYLFSLPILVFFAAANFYPASANNKGSLWTTTAVISISLILFGGFLFTRYGNERMDYKTSAEIAGVSYLYRVVEPNALLIQGWDGTPWMFKDYEKYNTITMTSILPDAAAIGNVDTIVQLIERENPPSAYLIFTRSQKVSAEMSGLPPDTLEQLEHALLKSGKFRVIYSNSDAQIFKFMNAK